MAFTRSWDETDPASANLAKEGAQEIREFKTDVRERLGLEHYAGASDVVGGTTGMHKYAIKDLGVGSSPYTATIFDHIILCNCAGGAITVNLPAVVNNLGKPYLIFKIDSTANAVTIVGSGSEYINSTLTKTIVDYWAGWSLKAHATGWIAFFITEKINTFRGCLIYENVFSWVTMMAIGSIANPVSFSAALYDTDAIQNLSVQGFTVTIASPGVITTATSHFLNIGQCVWFTTSGVLPTGLDQARGYFIIAAGFTATTFQVSVTPGGVAVNTSGSQSGSHLVKQGSILVVPTGVTKVRLYARIGINNLVTGYYSYAYFKNLSTGGEFGRCPEVWGISSGVAFGPGQGMFLDSGIITVTPGHTFTIYSKNNNSSAALYAASGWNQPVPHSCNYFGMEIVA